MMTLVHSFLDLNFRNVAMHVGGSTQNKQNGGCATILNLAHQCPMHPEPGPILIFNFKPQGVWVGPHGQCMTLIARETLVPNFKI